MSKAVIDTSVFLALIRKEPIKPEAFAAILGGYMSTVNVAEIYTKLAKWNLPEPQDLRTFLAGLRHIVPLSAKQAILAGDLHYRTAPQGLSLGDRCCLALAMEMGAEVYTCDRAWANVNVGCKVHLMR